MTNAPPHTGVPCAVVVDVQNVRGQARKVFGQPTIPSPHGIRTALARNGFDVVELCAGIATQSTSGNQSTRLTDALRKNNEVADEYTADGVDLLRGNLVERPTGMEEKQVDVLCALQVADICERINDERSAARCIVVLSEDMDLMPAYDFAERRGVPVYAAAFDTIYQRRAQHSWLLLDEPSLLDICQPPGERNGAELRATLARALTTDGPATTTRWRVHHARNRDGSALMTSNRGALGVWRNPGTTLTFGNKHDLYVTGVDIDPVSNRFPYLELSDQPAASEPTSPQVLVGTVAHWLTPTRVRVDGPTGADGVTLSALPGTLLPGQTVAYFERTTGTGRGAYLVGALDTAAVPPAWQQHDRSATARLGSVQPGNGWIPSTLTPTGESVEVHRKHLEHAEPGQTVRAILVGASDTGVPRLMPLTCCLPG